MPEHIYRGKPAKLDVIITAKSEKEENKAYNDYGKRSKAVTDPQVKRDILFARSEEFDHRARFRKDLKRLRKRG